MSKVLERLWLGGAEDAYNLTFMRGAKITHVINCAEELKAEYGLEVGIANIPLLDADSEEEEPDAREKIIQAASLLHKIQMHETNTILVHCRAGMSRSPTVILAWLILYKGYSYDDAWTTVAKARNIIYPNPFYRKILKFLTLSTQCSCGQLQSEIPGRF